MSRDSTTNDRLRRRLLASARYPDLVPSVNIFIGPGPAYKHFDYYDPPTNTIYWLGGYDPYAFCHELGHAYDYLYLSRDDRRKIEPLFGVPHRRWFWGNWNPETHYGQPLCEFFADAYATAQLHRSGRNLRILLRELRGNAAERP